MAENASSNDGFSLVIVESPAKARTIGRFLGKHYNVEASIGHIRDLPKGTKELPEEYKKEEWGRLGVNVNSNFEPIYVIPDEKRKQMKKLRDLMKNADSVYLATDEDREGEAISWHLCQVLKPKVPVHRLVFHEITKTAIMEALENPRTIDEDLVRAQETRRIVDRLYGYEVSPLLWRKVRPKLSAGRVQSVAVRLIVQRERDRIAFHSATYWDLLGTFMGETEKSFQAELISVGDRIIPQGKDFDPNTGKPTNPRLLILDEAQAEELRVKLKNGTAKVLSVENKPYTTRPYPPFTTSTLQQEANRKFGFTARTTMSLAQSLYENGHITYMRTDSTNLSNEAISAARSIIGSQYGGPYLPEQPRYYRTKVKNAQEAHEAIRPAGTPFGLPEVLKHKVSYDEFRLFDLIWKRTVASQMSDSKGHRVVITIQIDDAKFQVSGRTIDFPGYLRAYVEGSDDPDAELADRETVLPSVTEGQVLKTLEIEPKSHTTKPPQRFSEASLTRTLEEKGIGRPSTYASIIETILNRNYVFKRSNALVPTWVAFAVCQLLEEHLPDLVDYTFTAQMEDQLDAISRGELMHVDYLKHFYFGDGNNGSPQSDAHPGLKQLLENKVDSIDARDVSRIELGQVSLPDGSGDSPVVVRIGRYGPFLQHGERHASLPENLPPDELTLEKAKELLEKSEIKDTPLGFCTETGKPIFIKTGRFGPYVQRGTAEDGEKPQNASLLKGMVPEEVDLETALRLLSLPRELGKKPETDDIIIAYNGPYGPYIKCGSETRSLPEDVSPLDVTLEQALELLAQPKFRSARGAAKKSEPLREFEVSPVTSQPIKLLNGRYGVYITDGETNATLPKDLPPDDLTFEKALDMLAERAARGPSRRSKAAKRSTKKAAKKSTKKTVKKKTAKKKTVKKKAARKTTVKKSAAKKTTKKVVQSPE